MSRPAGDPSFDENKFDLDREWGMRQGDGHFRRRSDTFRTLGRVAGRLEGLGIAHAAAGALAFFEHGYRPFTEDVDLLVTADGLGSILDRPEAIGCVVPPTGRDQVRDLETGVRIDFLVAGRYPGDRKPGPFAFPDPGAPGVAVDRDGVKVLDIARLVAISLASGPPGGIHRMKDRSTSSSGSRSSGPWRASPINCIPTSEATTPTSGSASATRPKVPSRIEGGSSPPAEADASKPAGHPRWGRPAGRSDHRAEGGRASVGSYPSGHFSSLISWWVQSPVLTL